MRLARGCGAYIIPYLYTYIIPYLYTICIHSRIYIRICRKFRTTCPCMWCAARPTAVQRRGNTLNGCKDVYLKAKAESGLDCLICAIFSRQRTLQFHRFPEPGTLLLRASFSRNPNPKTLNQAHQMPLAGHLACETLRLPPRIMNHCTFSRTPKSSSTSSNTFRGRPLRALIQYIEHQASTLNRYIEQVASTLHPQTLSTNPPTQTRCIWRVRRSGRVGT